MSFQYQRSFLLQDEDHLSLSGGLGVALDKDDAFVPLTLSWNHGKKWHFLELGAGYTHRAAVDEASFAHLVVGGCFQARGGFLLKVRLTPLIPVRNLELEGLPFLPWGGVALGGRF